MEQLFSKSDSATITTQMTRGDVHICKHYLYTITEFLHHITNFTFRTEEETFLLFYRINDLLHQTPLWNRALQPVPTTYHMSTHTHTHTHTHTYTHTHHEVLAFIYKKEVIQRNGRFMVSPETCIINRQCLNIFLQRHHWLSSDF